MDVKVVRVSHQKTQKGADKTGLYDGKAWFNVFGNLSVTAGQTVKLKPSGIANWYELDFVADAPYAPPTPQNGQQQPQTQAAIPTPQSDGRPTVSAILGVIRAVLMTLPTWKDEMNGPEAKAMIVQSVVLGVRQGEIVIDDVPVQDDGTQAPWDRT